MRSHRDVLLPDDPEPECLQEGVDSVRREGPVLEPGSARVLLLPGHREARHGATILLARQPERFRGTAG